MAYGQFEQFIRNMTRVMSTVNTKLQRDLTLRTRVARRFSMVEVAALLGVDTTYLTRISSEEAAIIGSNPAAKRPYIHWRKKGSPVKVVTFGAQKGGTGKSLSAAHFAQYVNLHYGLRVGVIDADPQATVSLYFADDGLPLFAPDTPTLADFMGVDDPSATSVSSRSPAALNAIWRHTPWPGIKLIPGGANIQNGDISLFFMSQQTKTPVYRVLRDAIAKWDKGNGPRNEVHELRHADGTFNATAYQEALDETVDVIVIDQQPSLTLMQLNGLIAADNVVIPQTMKGFDLATLATYVSNIGEYMEFIMGFEADLEIGAGAHMVLPTIVQEQNTQDTDQILDLYRKAPRDVLQVWYARSDAIANAAEEYKSIYEYLPPKTRRVKLNVDAEDQSLTSDVDTESGPKPQLGGMWGGSAMNMMKQRIEEANGSLLEAIKGGMVAVALNPNQVVDKVGTDRLTKWDDDEDFQQLVANIKRRGQKQPIRVRPEAPDWQPNQDKPLETNDKFVIQSGRRRLEACRTLGLKVNAIIATPEADQMQADLEERFHENTMRRDLNGFEELLSIGVLAQGLRDMSQQDIADRLGVPQGDVSLGLACVEHRRVILDQVDITKTPKRAYRAMIPKLKRGERLTPLLPPEVTGDVPQRFDVRGVPMKTKPINRGFSVQIDKALVSDDHLDAMLVDLAKVVLKYQLKKK